MNLDMPSRARLSPALVCPRCRGAVDVKSRHVAVTGSAVLIYCSEGCRRGGGEIITAIEHPPRRAGWLLAAGLVVGGTAFGLYYASRGGEPSDEPVELAIALPTPPTLPRPPPSPPAAVTPPEVTEQQREDQALLVELMHDAWIHPLAGPRRRMPINHTAAFGAERAGERPPECASGHCGVDVGGSIWGEQVHAVHDGVVDWVNRGPNEERGGVFVKIAHREGALYSWYFHLAAVPRWIQPGVKITAGQVIGLLGDTGVKNSGPHLHFSMSVKASKGGRERYLDPEPLIAIWPLWIADDGKGHLSTGEPPGMPVREPARAKVRRVTESSDQVTTPEVATPEAPSSAEAKPEPPAADDPHAGSN